MGKNPQAIQISLNQSLLKTSSSLKYLFLCNYIYLKCLQTLTDMTSLHYSSSLDFAKDVLSSQLMDLNSPRLAELLVISCFCGEDV